MRHEPTAPVELASYDPPVARAVVAVLRHAGIPAEATGLDIAEAAGGEAVVLVPTDRRDAALAVVAGRMEDVRRHVLEHERRVAPPDALGDVAEPDDGGPHRPLVLERFRRLGFVAIALVPALVVTLANVRLPAAYIAAIVIGGIALLTAWKGGRFDPPERG